MTEQFQQIVRFSPGDIADVGVDLRTRLRLLKSETLAGTPTVVEEPITMGTMSASSSPTVCSVVDGSEIQDGDAVAIAGAGVGGVDLVTTIVSGGGTNALTLAAPCLTSVIEANVTRVVLSPSNAAINTGGTIEVEGEEVGIKQGLTFRITASVNARPGTTYYVLLTVSTSTGQLIHYRGACQCV